MLPDKTRLTETLRLVDRLLYEARYSELEQLSAGKHLAAEEIKRGIADYPEALTLRPSYDLEASDIVYVTGSMPAEWSVYLHLWRKSGGRSDLTVELTIIDADPRLYRVEIDGLHVL
jgi:hypothetical protein